MDVLKDWQQQIVSSFSRENVEVRAPDYSSSSFDPRTRFLCGLPLNLVYFPESIDDI